MKGCNTTTVDAVTVLCSGVWVTVTTSLLNFNFITYSCKSEVFLVPSLEVEQCDQNKISFVSKMPWNIRRVNTLHCALTVTNATILEIGVV